MNTNIKSACIQLDAEEEKKLRVIAEEDIKTRDLVVQTILQPLLEYLQAQIDNADSLAYRVRDYSYRDGKTLAYQEIKEFVENMTAINPNKG